MNLRRFQMKKSQLLGTVCACIFAFSNANAGFIDFESIPGSAPIEGLAINTQFLATEGVSFILENGADPVLAQVGDPMTAFGGPPNHTGGDTPAGGQNIGSFFLTDDGVVSSSLISPALIVSYSTPTSAASGVILDIDLTETFTIQAHDNSGNVLETINIADGDPNTGDGIATFWSFDRATTDIASIRFAGSRTLAGGFGLGFDNFNARSASVVPIPAAIWLFGSGLLGLVGMARRKQSV
jgi:hypothetical protein